MAHDVARARGGAQAIAALALALAGCAAPPEARPAPPSRTKVAEATPAARARPWAPSRRLPRATLDEVPCAVTLDDAREATPREVLAALLPDLDVETAALPEIVTPFPAWSVRLCVGRTLTSTTIVRDAAIRAIEIPALEDVAWPAPTVTLSAYRVTLGGNVLCALAAREGRTVRVLGVSDEKRFAIAPMVFVRLGGHEGVLRELPWLVSFRGHSRRALEFLPVLPGSDRGLFDGSDSTVNAYAGSITVAVAFHAAIHHDGWRPPWTATMSATPSVDADEIHVVERWTFVHGATGRVRRRQIVRAYRPNAEGDVLVDAPSIDDDVSSWPEVTEGVPDAGAP